MTDKWQLTVVLTFSLFMTSLSYSFNRAANNFPVYWNIPTESCHKYGMNFTELKTFGLILNAKDKFRGDKIAILYDPGLFPAIIGQTVRNGGIPQEGDLQVHLQKFKSDLSESIPDPNFSGIGVIDFEKWRPIWRENWGSLDIYRQRSMESVKQRHPSWPKSKIEKNAIRLFEKSGYRFMDLTLMLSMKMRPKGKWGYYAYPYCFNFSPKNPVMKCTSNVQKDNDRSSWMYNTGNALYPSVYLRSKELNEIKRVKMIQGRMEEAKRIAKLAISTEVNILPYFAIKYQDTFEFVSKIDMRNAINTVKASGGDGIILWGSSKDTNSEKKCQQLFNYVVDVLKPILK